MKRYCLNIKCRAEIQECMGFVLVRDILSGRKVPRELCGKCALKILYKENTDWQIEIERLVYEYNMAIVDSRQG